MSYQLSISDIGLRLIKAYEGYSPNGQVMRSGQRLVGYGRVTGDSNLKLSETEAETLLLTDLSKIENLINTNIHASMTQSQFDALCSLAYSIGTEAFLNSDVLHAMNRGEIIKAANGFDGWRLGNVDGQVYVVDALVRRRTAEKALFLRSGRTVPAPHEALQASQDTDLTREKIALNNVSDGSNNPTESNIVPLRDPNNNMSIEPSEPTATLQDDTRNAEIIELNQKSETPSPIAEAAAEVSDRLDALMGDKEEDPVSETEDWPDSLVSDQDDFEPAEFVDNEPDAPDFVNHGRVHEDIVIDNGTLMDSEGRYASADKFIEQVPQPYRKQNFWAFVTMIIFGLTMAGAGLWARMTGNLYFGDLSRLAWSVTFALGFLLFVMGAYYLFKQLLEKS